MALDQLSSTAYGTRVAQGYGADGGYLGPQESGAYSNNPFNNGKAENPMESGMGGGSLNASGMSAIIAAGGAPPGTDSGSTTPGSTPTAGGDGAGDEFGTGGINAQTTLGYGNTEGVIGGGEVGVGQPASPGPLGEFTDASSGIVDINNLANGQYVDEFGQVVSPTTDFSFLGAIGELFNVPSVFGLPPMLSPGDPTIHGQASEWEDYNQYDAFGGQFSEGTNTGTFGETQQLADNEDGLAPVNTTEGLSSFFGGEEIDQGAPIQGAPFEGAINAMEPTTPQDSGQDDISTPTDNNFSNLPDNYEDDGKEDTGGDIKGATDDETDTDTGQEDTGGDIKGATDDNSPPDKPKGGDGKGNDGKEGGGYADTGCFIEGTKVVQEDGTEVAIESVQIGDTLRGREGSVNVVQKFVRPQLSSKLLYGMNGETPWFTSEHPFMTEDGWKSVEPSKALLARTDINLTTLAIGDRVVQVDGSTKLIQTLIGVKADPDTQLYNFTMSGTNSYFANGYLVHNK